MRAGEHDLGGLPEVTALVGQGQVEGEAKWISDPGSERRLHFGPPDVAAQTVHHPLKDLGMHRLE